MTTIVGRHEPRKSRIISAVSPAAIAPSRNTLTTEEVTNTDWSNNDLIAMPEGAAARAVASTCLTALTTVRVEAFPFLMMLSIISDDVLLYQVAVPYMADVAKEDGRSVRKADRDVIERFDRRRHRIGP